MSLPNPETVVTEERLNEFYTELLPYLGGSADAGFTPVGTIISVMGVTAPVNYLACNGQVVNIADYPELANYFLQQFGSKNKFGGDGTTTFGIPDLRGEFLRGTGTNSHANQGNGANVGVHQDSTTIHNLQFDVTNKKVQIKDINAEYGQIIDNADKQITKSSLNTKVIEGSKGTNTTESNQVASLAVRPTNTSVLFCIATKNIYLNPSLDYSTDEKVVGTWIDGKPLYQKTFTGLMPTKTEMESHLGRYWYNFDSIANMDMGMIVNGFYIDKSENLIQAPIYGLLNQANGNVNAWSTWRINKSSNNTISLLTYANNSLADLLYLTEYMFTDNQEPLRYYITVQYTKTTS